MVVSSLMNACFMVALLGGAPERRGRLACRGSDHPHYAEGMKRAKELRVSRYPQRMGANSDGSVRLLKGAPKPRVWPSSDAGRLARVFCSKEDRDVSRI